MAPSLGTKLGPYEIVATLGAGGMGEVYRARDTRLDRTVAIKVLPQHLADTPEARQRFEREAKNISNLNHPHICVLYDVGSQDGVDYLVMECMEGETLAKRLEKGALPLEQVLKYGAQIADALDKAHRNGVIHRDLKPSNIMLTPLGAKLLDFGLSKPAVPLTSAATLTAAATPSAPMTQEGTIVGTFQYMSPEQVEAEELDGRSDIFSLGALLYEMLTGLRAFPGKSQLSVASAILEKEPASLSAVKPLTPPSLNHAITKCLAKLPDERWQSAGDLASQLKWVAEAGSQTDVPAPVLSHRKLRERLTQFAAVLMALTAIALAIGFLMRAPKAAQVMRLAILPPEDAKFVAGPPWGTPLAVSPDGQRIVFIALGKDGKRHLWERPFDSAAARPLPGTEDASGPFWSPDSQWVAFFAKDKLMRIAATGGEAQTLCPAQGGGGGTWSQRDVILFAPVVAGETGLFRIPAAGGVPTAVTTVDAAHGESNHNWPSFLPDGRHFLFSINRSGGSAIYAGDLDSPSLVRLLPLDANENSTLDYAPPGYLLYVRGGVLFAQSFDADRLTLSGESIRVVEGVEVDGASAAAFSVSRNGVLVFWGGAAPRSEQLTWVRRDGTRIATLGPPGAYFHFSLSPDGQRVAVTRYEPDEKDLHSAVWLFDAQRGTPTKFTFEWGSGMPVWSPDASHIAFASVREGPPVIYQKPSGGQGQEELLLKGGDNHPTDWSSDGRTIVYEVLDAKTKNDLWLLSPSGERKSVPFLQSPFNETGGRISPDGRWMAYTSDESGREEIYVTSYPEPRGKWRISAEGGTQAEWRHDGRELFYRAPDRKLMAVPINSGTTLDAGRPQALFEIPPDAGPWLQGGVDQREYAASSDGQRFLIGFPVGEEPSSPLTVVVNWIAGLKK